MHDAAVAIALAKPRHERLNTLREYLHHVILRLLAGLGTADTLAFVGGTALRVLHRLPRFSEDLDFSALSPGHFDVSELADRLAKGLLNAGYEVKVSRPREKGAVKGVFFRFGGLLGETGVTTDRRTLLSIKWEVDTSPPLGSKIDRSLVNMFFPIAITHHDLPTMMAGKLHAILARNYPKGRDWYDLAWYLTRPQPLVPNLEFLANALHQAGQEWLPVTPNNWKKNVLKRLESLDWQAIVEDVRPFLERPDDLTMLSPDLIASLLKRKPA